MAIIFPLKLGIGSVATLILGSLFGFVAFPKILHSQISKEMSLKKGTDLRDMWITVPFALDFKIYVFNCTNHLDVMKGAIPIVKEIGPYHYDEWKEKVNIEDIEAEDAIYYNRRDTFYFNKEKSGPGLTGDEIVFLPHIIILTTGISVASEKPTMLPLAGKAINGIYGNPNSVFVRTKVKDILFEGIIIDCNQTEFAPKAVCTVMKKVETFDQRGGGKLAFSIFGQKNGTIEKPKYKVLRGVKNIMDVGKVLEFNGSTSQLLWATPACNDYRGTDATVFPPFLTEEDELLSFTPDICRSLGAWYQGKSTYSGIQANRYISYLGDLSEDPSTQCFCDTPTTCPPKGLMKIEKCVRAPLVVSNPHFLHADPSVQSQVQGLTPNIEDHEIYIDFEPLSGTPLQAKKRIQLNIPLANIEKLDLFRNLTGTVMPILWIEEGLALNKTYTNMLKNQLFIPMKIVSILKWFMVWGGGAGILGSLILRQMPSIIKYAIKPSRTTVQAIGDQTGSGASPAAGLGAPKTVSLATANTRF